MRVSLFAIGISQNLIVARDVRFAPEVFDVVVPVFAGGKFLVAARAQAVIVADCHDAGHGQEQRERAAAGEGFDFHLAAHVRAARPGQQTAVPVIDGLRARRIGKTAPDR
jgi:hypothetical protein